MNRLDFEVKMSKVKFTTRPDMDKKTLREFWTLKVTFKHQGNGQSLQRRHSMVLVDSSPFKTI